MIQRDANRLASAGIILLALAVFLKNYWVGDDAYITFRAVEQLFAGNGPNFNPHERTQVYTSPAWYWLLAFSRVFVADMYLAAAGLSFALWTASLLVIRITVNGLLPFALVVLTMLSSNLFYDYTASGLTYPLAYLMLSVYLLFYVRRLDGKNDAVPALLAFGLILLVRHDIASLLAIPTAYVLWKDRRKRSLRGWLPWLALSAFPLAAWTMFSVIYYGFPFPNTWYAKTNIDMSRWDVFVQQGLEYWPWLIPFDVPGVVVIIGGVVAATLAPRGVRGPALALAAGILLNCLYVSWVGADFMLGRFQATAFMVALFVLYLYAGNDGLRESKRWIWRGRLATVLVLLILANANITYHHSPLASPFRLPWAPNDGTASAADNRKHYHWDQSLLTYATYVHVHGVNPGAPGGPFPYGNWGAHGTWLESEPGSVHRADGLGRNGYHGGMDKIFIDSPALSSPVLARTNAPAGSGNGHYLREITPGMMRAPVEGADAIEDLRLREYYRRMAVVTQSPNLFALERWKEIVLLNTVDRKYTPEEACAALTNRQLVVDGLRFGQ